MESIPSQSSPAPSISNLLNRHTVRARLALDDYDQAIERVGELLVKAGYTTPAYTQAMQRVLQEMGPYAVIAPGIALMHARPEDGVLKPCFALVTLSLPVPFGHSQNDPVDLVFAFGAVDKQAHIEALRQLAQLLSDPAALQSIRSAPNDETLLDVIQGWHLPE